uniref:Uncharacterized protein n=1 Tax=Molossus molossus TaxID=27622 RepID=A0A7J8F9R8_MOLMO|nr:hypothetical protein HJG59_008612 [Molossus molossus]
MSSKAMGEGILVSPLKLTTSWTTIIQPRIPCSTQTWLRGARMETSEGCLVPSTVKYVDLTSMKKAPSGISELSLEAPVVEMLTILGFFCFGLLFFFIFYPHPRTFFFFFLIFCSDRVGGREREKH